MLEIPSKVVKKCFDVNYFVENFYISCWKKKKIYSNRNMEKKEQSWSIKKRWYTTRLVNFLKYKLNFKNDQMEDYLNS